MRCQREQMAPSALRVFMCTAMCHSSRGIGLGDGFPWPHLKKDFKYYSNITQHVTNPDKKVVHIKGRVTYENTPIEEKSSPSVINLVISSKLKEDFDPYLNTVVKSYEEAMEYVLSGPRADEIETVWIMGGSNVYQAAVTDTLCTRIYLTRVFGQFISDVFFPPFEDRFQKIRHPFLEETLVADNSVTYEFEVYERLQEEIS